MLAWCIYKVVHLGMDTYTADMAKQWTGAMVKALRDKHKLTQGDIARELGLRSYVPVARWERAVDPTSPTHLLWERLDKLEKKLSATVVEEPEPTPKPARRK